MKSMKCLMLIVILGLVACERTDPTSIFVSPTGNDQSPGTRKHPIKTLGYAQELLYKYNPRSNIVINIASDKGPYSNQYVEWTYFDPNHTITFESRPGDNNAVFINDSDSSDRKFFSFRSSAGQNSNIIIRRLTIKNYTAGAISFEGDMEARNDWNGNNRIEDCEFENIGNIRNPRRHLAYSIVGLINSKNNIIRNCRFSESANYSMGAFEQDYTRSVDSIRLNGKYPNIVEYLRTERTFSDDEKQKNLPIIAIYIAHFSDSNSVKNCHFSYIKGDVLRIRDNSNQIQFVDNYVEICGWNAIVSTWFCNPFTQKCTKQSREKPSKGLLLSGNTVRGNWLYGYPRLYYDIQYRRTINDTEHLMTHGINIFNNDLSAMH